MAPEIIEHDDVALAKRWRQDLMYVESEQLGIDGAVENEGGVNPIMPQGGDEGHGLPVAVGGLAVQAPTYGRPAP